MSLHMAVPLVLATLVTWMNLYQLLSQKMVGYYLFCSYAHIQVLSIGCLRFTLAHTDIVAAAVLSANRNFEGRVNPLTRANYLASPPLVVAYALAGTVSAPHNAYHCFFNFSVYYYFVADMHYGW